MTGSAMLTMMVRRVLTMRALHATAAAGALAAWLLGLPVALAQPAPFNYPPAGAGGGGSSSCSSDISTDCSTVLGVGHVTTGVLGATNGGTGQATAPAARGASGLDIDELTGHGDSNYTILATDRVVATNAAFTAARTWTLPAANSLNPGQTLTVVDAFGTVNQSNTLTIAHAGTDTILGGTSIVITAAFGSVTLISDGVSKWSIPSTTFGQGGNAPTYFDANGGLNFRGGSSNISDGGRLNITGGGGSIDLGVGANRDMQWTGVGHIEFRAAAGSPTPSGCGTSPTIVGSDAIGRVTVGTAPSTTCTLTFAGSFTNAPICFAQDETSAVTMRVSSVSTTAVTFTASGTLTASDKISYRCNGYF